jgi:hypothetical protein
MLRPRGHCDRLMSHLILLNLAMANALQTHLFASNGDLSEIVNGFRNQKRNNASILCLWLRHERFCADREGTSIPSGSLLKVCLLLLESKFAGSVCQHSAT